jgi:hypothetical protein
VPQHVRDLASAGGQALSAAETAGAAHQDLAQAEQELADAKAALKRAENGPEDAHPADTNASEVSASPLAPASTVKQVKTAEADLEAATDGVTGATPLAQARAVVHAYTTRLQQALKQAGYWDGPVDGIWTPEVTEALTELRKEPG